MLKGLGIPHNVLNAKQHEREAEIVAQAGKQGAVTIATNMAGRGTDIMLGGNVTYMAKAALRKELEKGLLAAEEAAEKAYKEARAAAKAAGAPLPDKPAPVDHSTRLDFLLNEADGHADTDDAEVLSARKRFDALVAELSRKSSVKPRSCAAPAGCSSSAPSGMKAAALTTSCAAVPAARATRALPAFS